MYCTSGDSLGWKKKHRCTLTGKPGGASKRGLPWPSQGGCTTPCNPRCPAAASNPPLVCCLCPSISVCRTTQHVELFDARQIDVEEGWFAPNLRIALAGEANRRIASGLPSHDRTGVISHLVETGGGTSRDMTTQHRDTATKVGWMAIDLDAAPKPLFFMSFLSFLPFQHGSHGRVVGSRFRQPRLSTVAVDLSGINEA